MIISMTPVMVITRHATASTLDPEPELHPRASAPHPVPAV